MKFLAERPVLSWALYDWANSAFATTVIAGFFPVFLKQYYAAEQSASETTFYLGLVNAIASLVIVILAPFLGALADGASQRKRFLMIFAILGIIMTAGLSLVAQGAWLAALLLYLFAIVGFSGSNIFYDSLIMNVSTQADVDRVSSLGFALGYLGGGVLFSFNLLLVLFPESFGLAGATQAVQLSFISVAIWWAVFSLPVLLFVKEDNEKKSVTLELVRDSYKTVVMTVKHLRQLKMTFLFLLSYWFYIDGVDTIIRMAVDFGLAVGLESNGLLAALLITQFIGFPAALLFGKIGQRKGPVFGIVICLVVYVLIVLWAYHLAEQWEFYLLAIGVGLVQGGIQSLSRSMFSRLVPVAHKSEFFGFYNMLGKFAAVMGPLLVGVVSLMTGDPRSGILSVLILFALGGILLFKVNLEQGQRDAAAFKLEIMS